MIITPKRFRVAFSFSGEKREFVAQVASLLSKRFGEAAILYDKYHEAEFARRDLAFYLPDLYHKNSDLIVVVLSADYEDKEWCGLEWAATFDLLKQRKDDEVMLCRFNHANARGLFSSAGFVELDSKTPNEAAELILQRLAINEGKSKIYYLDKASKQTFSPSNLNYNLFEPCRFDLDNLTEKSMKTIIARNGLIGFALYCHSLTLLRQCCQRFKLELGRSNISVRDPFVIDPKFRPVEIGVKDVLRYRKLLEVQHVLLAVQISDEETAKLFWSSLKEELSGDIRHKLIILLAVSADCSFPEGTVALETPMFEPVHAYRWVREIVSAMKWPEDFIEFWVDSMITECGSESTELFPDHVYIHLDETTKFIRSNSDVSDFRAELKRREHIYVAS
ncbi:MAG TPA: TIR domain-containing protein [Pyrinomonadaceae bacterium]|jgi:hypothetical protein